MSALAEFAVFQVCNYKNQVACRDKRQLVLFAEHRSGNQQRACNKSQSKNSGHKNDFLSVLQIAWSDCENCECKNEKRDDAVC